MYILQNALQNIKRNKGRNILLGLVLLAIIATTVVGLVINSTTTAIIDDYRTRFGAEVFLSPDMELLRAEGRVFGRQPISAEMHELFATSRHLRTVNFTAEMPAVSYIQQPVGEHPLLAGMLDSFHSPEHGTIYTANMMLIGNSDTSNLPDFPNGNRQIIYGRMYEGINEAIVSMDFAEKNELQVGDIIEIRSIIQANDIPFLLTVVGIYFDATVASPIGSPPGARSNRRNEIFTSYETIRNNESIAGGFQVHASYHLISPDNLTGFEADVRAMGLSSDYLVIMNDATYQAIVAPVEGLRSISITFVIVVLVLGAVILVLLSTIAIRERKYEIGVLRAMGLKKKKVALGLLYEMVAITAICLVLGLGMGTLAAQPIATSLLERQIEAAESANQPHMQGGGGMMMQAQTQTTAQPQALSEIDVRLGTDAMAQIAVIALLLAIISSAVGIDSLRINTPIITSCTRNAAANVPIQNKKVQMLS